MYTFALATIALFALTFQQPAVSAQGASGEGTDQFLSLPMHPRPQADGNGSVDNFNANGIYRRGSHFIWQAPLVNGQPPGQTMDNSPLTGPGAPTSTALVSKWLFDGGEDVPVSTEATGPYHGETAAATLSSGVILAGSNRIYPGSCSSNPCGVLAYESADNGVTWTESAVPMTWRNTTFGITFDPAIAVDANDNAYYVLGGAPLSGNYPNSIAVSKRIAPGVWSTPVPVTFNRNRYFDDKYWIAVDRSATSAHQGRIYVVWDRNTSTNQILYVSYSDDGVTWSAPTKIDDGTSNFERVIGAYVTVGPDGTVYVSWHNYAQNRIYIDRSTDGGVTWGTDAQVATTNTGFGMDIGCNGGRKQSPAHHLIAGPDGTLHIVYANNIAGGGYDILYKTTANYQSWPAPVRLNDDTGGGHQYHPTLSLSGDGVSPDVVTVSFYDRRDDPSNCLTHVYSTRSVDGGASWSPNTLITSTASNFDGNSNGPGDYSSSRNTLSGDWAFFSDHTTSTFQIEGANLP
jgi:hypothetical protein